MANAPRDNNQITTLLAVSNADGITPVVLWADPTTHRLLVSSISGASGNDTEVQFNDGGSIGGDAGFTYNKTSNVATIGGMIISGLTASQLVATDASKNLVSLAIATYPSLTEISYVKGVTSAIQTQIDAKVAKSLFDANTIIAANADDTPVAVTVAEQTIIGRKTGGNITALTVSEVQAIIFSSALSTEILLGENYGIKHDAALSADGKYSGIVRAGTAGATLAFGDLIYLSAVDSRWELTDANATGTAGDVLLGICVLTAANDGDATTVLLMGLVRADTAFPTMTISAPQYVSETAGDITGTQPTTTDAVIRRVGFAWTADELYFNPSNDYITHT